MDKMTLKMRQGMSLEDKIRFTKRRIQEWVEYWGEDGVYVSFSGGKDSTVLLHIARELYPNIKAVYVDTGLEYPEIKEFVKSFENVDVLRPKMSFIEVIKKYGYPIVSKEVSECVANARKHLQDNNKYITHYNKLMGLEEYANIFKMYSCSKWKFLLDAPFKISNQCCNIMKKSPAHKYHKDTGRVPIIGTMAQESRLRTKQYLKQGCNGFNNKIPTSTPMAFWTEQDVLNYIKNYNIGYCSVYGDLIEKNGKLEFTGCHRTGRVYCAYGCHLEKEPNRFQKLAISHPKLYDYCINKLGFGEVLDYIGVNYKPLNTLDKGKP